MNRNLRLVAYGVVCAALLLAALAAPAAWATPEQNRVNQTIPTKTPEPPPVQPTEPPANEAPAPTAAAPATVEPATAVPGTVVPSTAETAQPGATAATCPSTASLTLTSDRKAVWPGATVEFTATLSNTGRQPLTQVVLEAQLAAGLEPVAVVSGSGTWQGRTLRVTAPSLAPGSPLAVVYSARVSATNASQAVAARAVASSAGCPRKTASVTLGMPPSQLPATGGRLD
ncbi:MAG: hypothetical protein ACM30E_12375 [Nitrososphaerales archaeon]